MIATVVAAVLASAACDDAPTPVTTGPAPAAPTPAEPRGDGTRGLALVARFECTRCHDVTGVAPAEATKHCVRCHQHIVAGTFDAPPEALARWREHVRSLVYAPSLEHVGARLSRSAIAAAIADPHDVRPGLVATMPRLAVTDAEALDLATALAPGGATAGTARPADDAATLARGRALAERLGCAACHAFSRLEPPLATGSLPAALDAATIARGAPLAPDLTHARDRVRPDRLAAWIRDPRALDPGALMPALVASDADADALASFVLHAPLAAPSARPPFARLAVLDRAVTFDEVNEHVFRRTCWHCHSDPGYALGDGGPGNTGGFGFAGRHLSLATYAEVMSGSVDDAGERRSIFRVPDGRADPLLVTVLLARREEEAGRPAADVRGMPLGLPALSAEQIQLVETWIAQGRPR